MPVDSGHVDALCAGAACLQQRALGGVGVLHRLLRVQEAQLSAGRQQIGLLRQLQGLHESDKWGGGWWVGVWLWLLWVGNHPSK